MVASKAMTMDGVGSRVRGDVSIVLFDGIFVRNGFTVVQG